MLQKDVEGQSRPKTSSKYHYHKLTICLWCLWQDLQVKCWSWSPLAQVKPTSSCQLLIAHRWHSQNVQNGFKIIFRVHRWTHNLEFSLRVQQRSQSTMDMEEIELKPLNIVFDVASTIKWNLLRSLIFAWIQAVSRVYCVFNFQEKRASGSK